MATTPLRLAAACRQGLQDTAEQRFPQEACGVLLGRASAEPGGGSEAGEVVECRNAAADPTRRYVIAPEDLFAVHRRCRAEGLEIVAYWHSHPTGSAVPSPVDGEHAFGGVSFLIVPVSAPDGAPRAGPPRAWDFCPAARSWRERPLETAPSPIQTPRTT